MRFSNGYFPPNNKQPPLIAKFSTILGESRKIGSTMASSAHSTRKKQVRTDLSQAVEYSDYLKMPKYSHVSMAVINPSSPSKRRNRPPSSPEMT